MSFYNQDMGFVLTPEIEKALAACLTKLVVDIKLATSDPQCIHKVHSVFTKCALNVPVIAELMREFYRTIRNMFHLRKMYRFWHISTEPIDRAENELCAAESAFTEMLNDTVAALSEIFLSLEAEKKALVVETKILKKPIVHFGDFDWRIRWRRGKEI